MKLNIDLLRNEGNLREALRAAQERDAEILKNELHVNIVRTSHYPQSTWFLDHCDRLGLLVFEEIRERKFCNWTMGHVDLSKVNPGLLLKYHERAVLNPFEICSC